MGWDCHRRSTLTWEELYYNTNRVKFERGNESCIPTGCLVLWRLSSGETYLLMTSNNL